jgi:F-type H+-transporting ATPase subunit delta
MRAASRETYAAAAEKLDGVAAAGDPAEQSDPPPAEMLASVGDELLAVAGLLDREPRLRRALADPARAGKDRAALLDGLVANSVGADTRALLMVIAAGRWSSSAELLDGVELLGVNALLASADRAGDLGEVEDELFRFGQVIDGSPQLAAALGDPTVAPVRRAELIDSLLGAKAKPATLRLAKLALAGFGGRTFTGALTRLVELAASRRDRQVAYVTSARPLAEADEQRLAARLAEMYGRQMAVKVTVDPSVLGGLRVLVGSDLYDGTMLRRLDDARHALAGN